MKGIDSKSVEALLEKTIRDTLRHGKNQTCLEITPLAGGLTEIEGTFDLAVVAQACLAAIEQAGFKVVPK